MQFIAAIPDQRNGSDLVWQIGQMEREGFAPPAHGQDQPLPVARNRLGGPLHRPVLLRMVGIAVPRVRLTQLLDGLDIGEKLLADQLDGLTVQRKLPALGFSLQVVAVRPTDPLCSGALVPADTIHPDASGFQLRSFEACSRPPVQILESIDTYGLHSCSSRSAQPV